MRSALRKLRSGLRAFDDLIAKIETGVLVVILGSMVLLAFSNIVGRMLQHGVIWAEPVLKRAALYLAFIGASLATKEARHINIDIMSRVLPKWATVVVGLVVNVVAIGICVLLTRAGLEFIEIEKDGHESPFWGIPNHRVALIIPIGFAMICYRFSVRLVDQIIALILQEDIDYGSALPAEAAAHAGGVGTTGEEATG